jgi:uridine monophosphate synthetase
MPYKTLIHSLYKIGAIKFGDFTLKSGQSSKIYIDLRQIVSYPDILRDVAEAIWQRIYAFQFDVICGVPYTALPIATCLSLLRHLSMIMRRKEKKEYGTKQVIEGSFRPGQTCLVIEDIITTGSSILETTADLEAAGLKVRDVAVLIDRQQGGKENLEKKNYQLHAVFTLEELLYELLSSNLLPADERVIVSSLVREGI